ncbi:syntaxin [Aspergillus lucknowensis]|uniref:t-SNARE n=1 Tax=Aspergillus lucknowensis TaxID=176173 RepID=A0ABR4LID6_9EURO
MSYNQQPSYADRPAYGAGYGQDQYSNAEHGYGGGSYEMNSQPADPTTLLNKCRDINDGIREVKTKREGQLAAAQNALLESNTGREDQSARQALDYVQSEIMANFHKLREDLQKIKSTPGSNQTHVQNQLDVTSRNFRAEMEQYQKNQSEFQKRLKEQVRRRYQIANPEASPDEIDQGVENILAGTEQSFQVAGARTKRANDVRQAVLERSAMIKKLEQGTIEISELMQQLDMTIAQQEPAVEQINRGAESVAQDLGRANTQLGHAVDSARRARKWKWYALIIIIIIIAIIVGLAVGLNQ